MKKLLVTAVSLIFIITGIAFAKDYEINKKAGELNVLIAIDKNPPVIGKNNMAIEIKDPSGRSVTDATVKIEYSMPAMPGMPAMNYKTDAEVKGSGYKALMDIPMPGSWNVIVKITSKGKPSKLKFSIDVN